MDPRLIAYLDNRLQMREACLHVADHSILSLP
jgi:hypothetical protein